MAIPIEPAAGLTQLSVESVQMEPQEQSTKRRRRAYTDLERLALR